VKIDSLKLEGIIILNLIFVSHQSITAASSTSYQWDAANRLKSVNNGSLGSYGYDGNGKRVKKTESGVTTYYVISSVLGSVLEVTSAGVQRAYVMSNGAVVAQLNPNGSFYWLHLDHLGSGRKMTDTSGTMVYRAEFDPYGKLLYEWSSPSNLNTKKFTGYERDGATNLDYAQARMYASDWGRFQSPDPAGMKAVIPYSPQSLNRYAYTDNNPVNRVDRTGLGWVVELSPVPHERLNNRVIENKRFIFRGYPEPIFMQAGVIPR
jgi:RHS repeat-associated protein